MSELDLFNAAIKLTGDQRSAFLAAACGQDSALRKQVEDLLRAHEETGGLLPRHNARDLEATQALTNQAQPGTIIAGRYKLLEAIGEGGMGTVWVAEQSQPVKRKVALKLIKAGMDSKSVLARFEAERQALAVMDHPNIAKVLDGGITESGRPYFVMEYVKGVPITEYCDATRMSVPERLQLFAQVCQAVQHAHQKGIIHRDLKPSNILVAPYDDKPVPKVIDFGLAKAINQSLTENTLHTAHDMVLGTPLYMSPEQSQLNNIDIDTRSDIYSLGVLLYELLTGSTPLEKQRFKQAAWDEMRRMIREEDPPLPSLRLSSVETLPSVAAGRHTEPARLTKLVRGELDWIVMKALEKDRMRRYETASDFTADVQRYLDGEPVQAAPPSRRYRISKYASKHRAALTTSVAIVLLLIIGIAVSSWQALRAVKAEQAAIADRDRAKNSESAAVAASHRAEIVINFLTQDLLAQADPENNPVGDKVTVREVLDRASDRVGDNMTLQREPEVEATIRKVLGSTYDTLGLYQPAEIHYRRALEVFHKIQGEKGDDTLEVMAILGQVLRNLERLPEAEQMTRDALIQRRDAFGNDHLETLALESNLAILLKDRGKLVEAEQMFRENLEATQRALGPKHEESLVSILNLAWMLMGTGQTEKLREAASLLRDHLEEFKNVFGEDKPKFLMALNEFAESLRLSGELVEAEKYHRQSLERKERVFGPTHDETLGSMNNLGLSLLGQGQIVEAEELFRKIESVESKTLPDSVRLAMTRNNLALTLDRGGKLTDAIELYRKSLPVFQRVFGGRDSQTLRITLNFARALRDDKQFEEAQSVYETIQADSRLGSIPDVSDWARFPIDWGILHLRLQEFESAEAKFREAISYCDRNSPDTWLRAYAHTCLGDALLHEMKFAEAEPLLLAGYEGMKLREAVIPWQGKVLMPEALDRLIELYTATDKPDEGQKWRTERAKYPPSSARAMENR